MVTVRWAYERLVGLQRKGGKAAGIELAGLQRYGYAGGDYEWATGGHGLSGCWRTGRTRGRDRFIEVANTGNGLLKGEDCEFNTGVKENSDKKNSARKYFLKEAPRVTQEPAKAWKGKATAEPAKGPAKKLKRPFPRKSEDLLKEKMTSNPVIVLPALRKSCGSSIGAVLMQEGRVVAYESRILQGPEKTMQVYEKELKAVIHGLLSWKHYLLGADFVVQTDHQTLRYFLTQAKLSKKHMRWENILSMFHFKIVHVEGKKNVVADTLSRKPQISAVSIPYHHELDDMREQPLRRKVMEESHVPPYAGHRGIDATVKAVETFFYWPTLRRDVDAFVRECIICQKVKFDRQKAPGLLQPLPIPDKQWESIAMDFIFDLPKTQTGNDGIWTIICRFSKQAHFIPIKKKIKLDQMTRLFMSNIFKYHGMPQSIVSDRDPRMTSLFWRGLFENMGTTLKFSSSFHPQTDGQSEEANSTVLDLLKCYVSEHKGKWEQYLPLVEYAYNNTMHSSTGKAPFEIAEGGKKVPPILHTKDKIFEADKYVQDMDEMYKKAEVTRRLEDT
ncbi:hypothetical protein L7F22_027194 [Adiantum nelumboides]|nr:hypothetical protein [Adiantum nelumboides]